METTTVRLEKMRFHAYHGVLAQERKVGNAFEVSVAVKYPFQKALTSDKLEDTLNYAELYELVSAEMKQPSQLLEHVAGRIIESIKAHYPLVSGGCVSVTKLHPPFKCELAGVTVEVQF